jgi:hypothetical protein
MCDSKSGGSMPSSVWASFYPDAAERLCYRACPRYCTRTTPPLACPTAARSPGRLPAPYLEHQQIGLPELCAIGRQDEQVTLPD